MTTRGTRHIHSIHCILPPYLLRSIAENGTPQQRVKALHTVATDSTFRALRFAGGRVAASTSSVRRMPAMMVESQRQRSIYDLKGEEAFPGTLVRSEGQGPCGDTAADEAFEGLGATYDFFWEILGRNSIDGDGMPLQAYVHYGRDYDNAFWDGRRMVFGDGDGELFNRFTIALDVIAHELAHGVTEDEGPLWYFRQAGALNESMSDVFGSLVKQRLLGQTVDQADWLIGAGLLAEEVEGTALRSMKEPGTAFDDDVLGKDPQPGHMRDYVNTWEDNGGVHINSGIPNRAFCLTAMSLGGSAWERAGRIWYEAMRDPRIMPDTNFSDFARITVMAATRLYGAGNEEAAVKEAWEEVGIRVSRDRVSIPQWGPGGGGVQPGA
ncbi:peptidase M4 family protein [Myxococcus llanfairpwllgwyngyllgogerychwyrndrobwllllantysiliogogogochensis]|uniref:Neutral metalloproteinase n=1 Tax=Myxococcus llanfairpwllgwyngyllgogerychwyrndrobwllllantysiliogogogochensis TaxID=2590453 RepID=A0A540X488_9BACT|nr:MULTISPECIES: M4 family metallopeptidase [Myxococcus]NTX41364.1 M4 family metallopeptidase [Myxococcus sp. CA033]TQF15534.1 peptidase M4 family protein [Myxococcus llanfairpwllgwyngyllgogerychwyrndrobwllllantysiliogogogochensis]